RVEQFLGKEVDQIVLYVPFGKPYCLVKTAVNNNESVPLSEVIHSVESTLAARLFPKLFASYTSHIAYVSSLATSC
ncbi:hypothetical protein PFISCL1PPCAC_13535, partial [Pristionchus fissidentatus]